MSDADRDEAVLRAMAEPAGLDVERDRLELETVRALVTNVTGPDNPAWSIQMDIARQVLAKFGIPVEELERLLAEARERDAQSPGNHD